MLNPLCLGKVDVEVSSQDRVHAILEVDDRCGNVLIIVRTAQRDLSPNNETMPLTSNHQEAEGIGA